MSYIVRAERPWHYIEEVLRLSATDGLVRRDLWHEPEGPLLLELLTGGAAPLSAGELLTVVEGKGLSSCHGLPYQQPGWTGPNYGLLRCPYCGKVEGPLDGGTID